MFVFLYRKIGGIVFDDLQKAKAELGSAGELRQWISDAGDIGLIWTSGTLLTAQGDETPKAGQPFALAAGRLDSPPSSGTATRANTKKDEQLIADCALKFGETAPLQLFGEYALAHWTGHALFIATDHLGQSPVYYARTENGFVVATRLTALLAVSDAPRTLDGLGLALVAMIQMGRGAGYTPYIGIRSLIGGHGLYLDAWKESEPRRWWNPDYETQRSFKDPRDLTAEIQILFEKAVRCRLPATGPVGCTLSGGLDSTLVAGFAAPMLAQSNRQLHAWTSVPHPSLPVVARPRWDNSDWEYASQMAQMHPNIQHSAVSPEGICLLDVLDGVHASSATPTFVVANHLWLTEIGRRAHEAGCKVVLAGFHGNSSISFAGNGGVAQLLRGGKWSRAISHLKRAPNINSRTLFRYALHAMLGDRIYALLNEQRNSLSRPFSPPGALFVRPMVSEYYSHRPIELTPVMQRRDWMHFITRPKTSFAVDIKAHAGIEFRDPTSDRRLCEYLLGCPTDAFVGEGFERLQARLLGAGHVPDSIRWRRTLGDQVPEQAGFFSLYPERYRDAWEQVRCLPWTEEFIDVSASNRVFEDLVNGRTHPRLLASALHRILDIGTFIIDAKRRWQVTT